MRVWFLLCLSISKAARACAFLASFSAASCVRDFVCLLLLLFVIGRWRLFKPGTKLRFYWYIPVGAQLFSADFVPSLLAELLGSTTWSGSVSLLQTLGLHCTPCRLISLSLSLFIRSCLALLRSVKVLVLCRRHIALPL